MITRILKMFIYALIVFFMIAGIISMKDKFMKFDTNESFEEDENKQDINEDDEEEEMIQNTNDDNKEQNESTNNEESSNDKIGIDPSLCDPEIIRQIKNNFTTKFNQLKVNMNNDFNNFQRILESDIHNVFVAKEIEDPIKEGVDPIVMYNTETFVDDDDEEDDEVTEKFTQDIYDGITSPYCLNCKEL